MTYLDANIFVKAENPKDEDYSEALEILERIEAGEIRCCTSVLTVDEVVYNISRVRGKRRARETWRILIEEPNLDLIPLSELDMDSAKEFYPELDPRDCIHAQAYIKSGTDFFVTEDEDFDEIQVINNVSVSEFSEEF